MENEQSAKGSKNKIHALIKTFQNPAEMRFGMEIDIQLVRFYCKTNGK